MNKLLFTGELPPNSINGIAYSNEINLNLLKKTFNIYIVEEKVIITDHKKITTAKLLINLERFIRIIFLSIIHDFKMFYLTFPTSTTGVLKTITLLLVFKLFNIKSKIILHLHRGDIIYFINKNRFNLNLFQLTIKLTNKFIVLSKRDKTYLSENFSNYNCFFSVLSNTLKKDKEYDVNTTNEHKLTNFIYVSNYIEEKGILDLLETFKNINLDINLECFGNFTNDKLKFKILSYSSEKIHINGPIYDEDKFDRISKSDCLILPSHNEGMPLILLESMLVGTPFITTSVGCVDEMIYNEYPYVYNFSNKSSLIDLLHLFVNQKLEDYYSLRIRLKKYYIDNFSLSTHEIKLNNIFLNES